MLIERTHSALRGSAGQRVIVAVSGGSDSVALLLLVHRLSGRLGLEIEVGHFDHGTRGEQSTADARFVEELSGRLKLPFWLGRWSPGSGSGFEARARQARYKWLGELALERGATAVLVAHTRDDQAETILHRLVRGTGPRGLRGIPPQRELVPGVLLRRPLLWAGRESLHKFLREQGQEWREDPTNLDLSRTRARIRHVLLPELASAYNPRVVQAIARLARLQASEQRILEAQARRWFRACQVEPASTEMVRLDQGLLAAMSLGRRTRVLRAAWQGLGWPEQGMSAVHWYRLARLVDEEITALTCPSGIQAQSLAGELRLTRIPDQPGEQVAPIQAGFLPVPGTLDLEGRRFEAVLDPESPGDWDEVVDFDHVDLVSGPDGELGALIIRQARAGDRFAPLGLAAGSMALADFFRGRKIDQAERCKVPLVCDANEIIWVAGHRISHRVRQTGQTTRRLGLRWHRLG